jgi:hypothetical protein
VPVPPPLPDSGRPSESEVPRVPRTPRTGIAIALVASLAVLATAGFLLFQMRARLPVALRTQPSSATTTAASATDRAPSAFAESAIRALLGPSPDGVPRVTPLGAFTTTAKGGRLETPLVTIDLPAGGSRRQQGPVSRVNAAPPRSRESLPVDRWGKYAPISPIFDVDTEGRALTHPATVSVPVANAAGLESFTVQTWDPKTGAWDAFPARYDAGTGRVSADVRHFSLIVVIALVGGAIAGERWIDYEYSKAAACVDSTRGCSRCAGARHRGTRSYVTPGKNGRDGHRADVAEVATALENAHETYAAASLRCPARDLDLSAAFSAYAEFNAPGLIGSPYILVDQASTPLLAQASAAHSTSTVQHLYMNSKTSPWWREASAVAVETQLFPANLSWITDYYSAGSGTIEFASRLGRDESSSLYGYRVSLFSVFLARNHGGLDFQRRVLERHAGQPILPAVAATLGGEQELARAWLTFGRSLVGPDWGSYLSADERRTIQRQYDLQGLRLDPTRGALSEERPETPLSVYLYDVRLLKNRLAENGKGSGPLLVRLLGGGSRALHVIAPGTGANSAPAPVNAPALSLIDRPVNVSLTGQDPPSRSARSP